MNQKIKWFRERMRIFDLDGMIVSNPINIEYLTGLKAEGMLLITRKENIFLTDSRYIEEVKSILTVDDEIIINNYKDLIDYDYERFFSFCENVGFEEYYATYAKYKEYKQKFKINNLEETEKIIEKQRAIKEKSEIIKIKKACEITDKCFNYLLQFIKVGKTEIEIAKEIERFLINNGADDISFKPIVASGPNSSKPHAVPTERKITVGDVVLLDFGCKYKGYCSDMSRTVFMNYVTEKTRKLYNLILEIKEKAQEHYIEGKNLKTIVKMVETEFKLNNQDLIHSLGHGVGLEIHELPFCNLKKDCILKENMVLTNEPGIYIPGMFGIRIEDTVLINKDGAESLTKSNRDIIVIK
ncbi:MAG: Xaa-Pro peptidase family protein [Clostridia bacterium]|nr:Xaa-Pro peptidase family protein [Clostridia bacterium]